MEGVGEKRKRKEGEIEGRKKERRGVRESEGGEMERDREG